MQNDSNHKKWPAKTLKFATLTIETIKIRLQNIKHWNSAIYFDCTNVYIIEQEKKFRLKESNSNNSNKIKCKITNNEFIAESNALSRQY